MAKPSKKKMGRPRVNAVPINVRFPPDEVAALDDWIAEEAQGLPTRAQAVRHLVAKGIRQ